MRLENELSPTTWNLICPSIYPSISFRLMESEVSEVSFFSLSLSQLQVVRALYVTLIRNDDQETFELWPVTSSNFTLQEE